MHLCFMILSFFLIAQSSFATNSDEDMLGWRAYLNTEEIAGLSEGLSTGLSTGLSEGLSTGAMGASEKELFADLPISYSALDSDASPDEYNVRPAVPSPLPEVTPSLSDDEKLWDALLSLPLPSPPLSAAAQSPPLSSPSPQKRKYKRWSERETDILISIIRQSPHLKGPMISKILFEVYEIEFSTTQVAQRIGYLRRLERYKTILALHPPIKRSPRMLWTSQQTEMLLNLYTPSVAFTYEKVAQILIENFGRPFSTAQIINKLNSLKIPRHFASRSRCMYWSPAQIKYLSRLVGQKTRLSSKEIAEKINEKFSINITCQQVDAKVWTLKVKGTKKQRQAIKRRESRRGRDATARSKLRKKMAEAHSSF